MNAIKPIAQYWQRMYKPSDEGWTYGGKTTRQPIPGGEAADFWVKPNPDFDKFNVKECPRNQQVLYGSNTWDK